MSEVRHTRGTEERAEKITPVHTPCALFVPISKSLIDISGAPNDGFLQNTFKRLLRLSEVLGSLKWRYIILISSVILGELKSFRNYKGFGIIFPKILDAI